jgi:hypothetical protein
MSGSFICLLQVRCWADAAGNVYFANANTTDWQDLPIFRVPEPSSNPIHQGRVNRSGRNTLYTTIRSSNPIFRPDHQGYRQSYDLARWEIVFVVRTLKVSVIPVKGIFD